MDISRSIFARAIGLVFSIAMVSAWAPATPAQDDNAATPADEISCQSNFGNPVELDKKYWSFVPATAQEIASVQKSKPELSAGPFSGGKYAYDRVDIYLTQEKGAGADSGTARLSLYARALQNQKESWFKIAQDKEAGVADYDFFDLSIGAEGGDTGGDAGESPDENSGARVSFAVKSLNAPIFRVSWSKHNQGASVFAEVRKILLLDFRSSTPAIVAALQCVSAQGGGACGDWDNGAVPTTTLACNWDAVKADFLCTSTATGDYTVPLDAPLLSCEWRGGCLHSERRRSTGSGVARFLEPIGPAVDYKGRRYSWAWASELCGAVFARRHPRHCGAVRVERARFIGGSIFCRDRRSAGAEIGAGNCAAAAGG
jgi:hypothetical protein